ncbi:hypothetical protein [Marivita sp.]|uniref:hypothetical protein n=1 Tax=Marivita sp. TaxID=2003365 RepID=UPI003F6A5477
MINLRVPFFRPLLRRALTTGITLAWALFELSLGNPGWALLFGAVGAYCAYEFFVVFDPENYQDKNDG